MPDNNLPQSIRPPFLVRRRTVFTWIVPVVLLACTLCLRPRYSGWPADFSGLAAYFTGIAFVVLGEIVRFWAAGYIAKDAEITTGGPYAHVRNPLYFGSMLLAVGYALVSGLGLWAVAAMLALFLLFHLAAILYEETFLKANFGQAYDEYFKRVPRLLPSPLPRTGGGGHYDFAQALKNREHISALFALAFVILLSVRFLVH
jgi:protein-S-isoprenylcysteine O-methyltransferase Ste14